MPTPVSADHLTTGFGPEQTALRWQHPVTHNNPANNNIRMCVPSRVDMGVDMCVDMETAPYQQALIGLVFLSQPEVQGKNYDNNNQI